MGTLIYRELEEALHRLHLEVMQSGDMCRVCRWEGESRKLHCTVDNVAKCPAVAAQINQVHLYLIGMKPMTRESWIKDDTSE